MQVEMSNREAALVLAALRNWQDEAQTTNLEDLFEAYFENEDPLEHEPVASRPGLPGEDERRHRGQGRFVA